MAVAAPTGRLTKKIQCQFSAWVRMPPASRPTAAPADATKANTPIALACSLGSGNMVTIMPSITAEVAAPPIPCRNRAPTSISRFAASPHSSDAAVKVARPARKTFLRPARSPSRPASNNSPAKAIRWALTTQARPACEKPRSAWMDGSATFTMVMSSTIISIPVHSTTRAIQRLRSRTGPSPFTGPQPVHQIRTRPGAENHRRGLYRSTQRQQEGAAPGQAAELARTTRCVGSRWSIGATPGHVLAHAGAAADVRHHHRRRRTAPAPYRPGRRGHHPGSNRCGDSSAEQREDMAWTT